MTHSLLNKAAGTVATLVLALMPAACTSKPDGAETAVARVGSAVLTVADLRNATPRGLSAEDSTAFVDAYVNTWISDMLVSEVAARKLRSTDEIEKRVDEYRRQLIMWEYRNMAVAADTAMAITDADVRRYYADHESTLKLTEPMVRGIYIKIETSAPALAEVKRLYKSSRHADIDKLEKVGLRGAIHYDYFRDQWIPWHRIITKIPRDIPATDLRRGYSLEFEADGFTYLLSVSDVLPAGATMPYEAAEPQIRETLDALRRTEVDARLRARLRREAERDGTLVDNRH